MSRILVTGALGHIGSRFIHGLKENDFEEVILLDNLSTQRYVSLFDLPKGVRFRFVEDDVCTADLTKLLKGVDVTIHLAAITNAAGSFAIQEEVERVNFEGTRRVAEACLETGSQIVFLSTTSVYGTQNETVDEDCSIEELKPQSPYAASKLKAEQLLGELHRKSGLNYVALRFGTIFGVSVGMRFHTAINKFVWQACLNKPITVWRTALHQRRPYLELGDAVRALHFVVNKSLFTNAIYNVLTINATVEDIVEALRIHVPDLTVEFVDTQIMNQLSYHVACSKFQNLGFTFKGNLKEGIEESIALLQSAYYR